MSAQPMITQNRLGLIALVLLSMACVFWWIDRQEMANNEQLAQWQGGAMRMGLLLGAIYLAWPDLSRLPPKLTAIVVAGLVVSVFVLWRWPKYLPLALGLFVVLYFLRPRKAKPS